MKTSPDTWNPATLAMNSKTAATVSLAIGSHDAILEPKYDGIRLLIHRAADGVKLYARSGNSKTGKLPAIEAELAALPVDTWLDGEAVAFNADGTQDWGGAQSCLGSTAGNGSEKIRLVIFDLLAHGGLDARSLPLRNRRELLDAVIASGNFTRVEASTTLPATEESHEALLELGFEGSMVKHLDAAYQSGRRSPSSLKLKSTDTVDAVITGFKPGAPDSWIAAEGLIGAIEFEHYAEDGTAIPGRCSGMTVAKRREISADRDALINTVIEVSYMTRMPSGTLRHPQYKRLRTDKTAAECRS